jgi:hypothetical protein
MSNNKVKIEFISSSQELLDIAPKPYPSANKLPDWYKKTPSYINGIQSVDQFNDPSSTIKKCMPIFDIMTAGYHIPLHSDVWVENAGDMNISFRWSWDTIEIVSVHPSEQHSTYPIPPGYHNTAFKWISPWIIKTPPGWSCIFTHPYHYDDLPFRSFSALVDTDKHPAPTHFPFLLKKGFNGLIPLGTPMIQVIPFKRETFTSEYSVDDGSHNTLWQKAHSVFFDRYKKFFRSPKTYEDVKPKESKCPFAFMHNPNK